MSSRNPNPVGEENDSEDPWKVDERLKDKIHRAVDEAEGALDQARGAVEEALDNAQEAVEKVAHEISQGDDRD
ncbi:MAG: hypothetical protein QOJ59_4222 [Thermomicrobiales bacterium]|jgi:hypothetical protein|nr:hypothetical protein [Thermomicrobiales bacterium]